MAPISIALDATAASAAFEDRRENGKYNQFPSKDLTNEEQRNRIGKCKGRLFSKGKLDSLLPETSTSIADALLQLGTSDDGSAKSSCIPPTKRKKRTISFVGDSLDIANALDAKSTVYETDTESNDTYSKRPRTGETKSCFSLPAMKSRHSGSVPLVTSMNDDHEGNFALTFSVTEFQLRRQDLNEEKTPVDIGCISNVLYSDFRPLRAPPQLPTAVIPPCPLPPSPTHSPQILPNAGPHVLSSIIAEHNDCVVMHSYTILPKRHPHPHSIPQHALFLSDFQPLHRFR